jgi:hypothetical protein
MSYLFESEYDVGQELWSPLWGDVYSLWQPSHFTPAELYRGGVNGVWFDFSDLGVMFQDSAGTIPVTAADQPVGKILDKSGNNNHASQTTDAKRPMLRSDGNLWWLEFDGVDDWIAGGSFVVDTYYRITIFEPITVVTNQHIINGNGGYNVGVYFGNGLLFGRSGVSVIILYSPDLSRQIVIQRFTTTGFYSQCLPGGIGKVITTASTVPQTGVSLGGYLDGTGNSNIKIFGDVLVNTADETKIERVKEYLAQKYGVTL